MGKLVATLLAGSALFGLALTGSTAASAVDGVRTVKSVQNPAVGRGKRDNTSPQSLPLPRLRTLPAAGIHATNVVLLGEINARNGIANFRFQYGRSKRYDTTLEPNEEFVTGSLDHKVAEAVTRLRPRTTYHFRIIAFNRSGSVAGRDRTFTTSRPGT
jgi:hypothetical protein